MRLGLSAKKTCEGMKKASPRAKRMTARFLSDLRNSHQDRSRGSVFRLGHPRTVDGEKVA